MRRHAQRGRPSRSSREARAKAGWEAGIRTPIPWFRAMVSHPLDDLPPRGGKPRLYRPIAKAASTRARRRLRAGQRLPQCRRCPRKTATSGRPIPVMPCTAFANIRGHAHDYCHPHGLDLGGRMQPNARTGRSASGSRQAAPDGQDRPTPARDGNHHHAIATTSPRRSGTSTRDSTWCSASTTRRRSARSSARPNSTRRRRCRTGASRGRWGPTTTSMSTMTGRSRRTRRSRRRWRCRRRIRGRARVHRGDGDQVSDRCRSRIARRWRASTPTPCAICRARYPDDLDAATLYAESLMNLRAWKLWSLDGKPAERTERDRRRARVGARARSESPRRQPLLHPHGGGVADAGPCAAERGAAGNAGAGRRPSGPHARPYLRARRRPGRRRPRQRGGREGRPRVLQDRAVRQLLRPRVLQPTTCTSSPTPK